MFTRSAVAMQCSRRLRSFDDAVVYHQRNAIEKDLLDLLSVPRELSTPSPSSFQSGYDSVTVGSALTSKTSRDSSPTNDTRVCQVQFKHVNRHCILPDMLSDIKIGDFVIIESLMDKLHEDLGVVTAIYSPHEFDCLLRQVEPSKDAEENMIGRILRRAVPEERWLLPLKHQREQPLLRACQAHVDKILLPMTVYGVEYQFDGNVLFVYYVSENRVDFRPLVRYLARHQCPGVRIQMKKTNLCREFIPLPYASRALATGQSAFER